MAFWAPLLAAASVVPAVDAGFDVLGRSGGMSAMDAADEIFRESDRSRIRALLNQEESRSKLLEHVGNLSSMADRTERRWAIDTEFSMQRFALQHAKELSRIAQRAAPSQIEMAAILERMSKLR